jgi:hypothetical protein
VRHPGDEQEQRATAVALLRILDIDLDRGYEATAIPGMLFSSPSSAELTFTEKLSMASGVSRSL